jgi:transcriptional regulator with XRE-family HTH domain
MPEQPHNGRYDAGPNSHTADLGWRLQQLRLRRGLQQKEFARLAQVDAGFLNRLERGASRRSHPKPDTINKLLDALEATTAERAAVFHTEPPPITQAEIDAQVAEFASLSEADPQPHVLVDEHWYRHYMNGMARHMFGLSDAEYQTSRGEHVLQTFIDPSSPLYSRYPDDSRITLFAQRLYSFKMLFANQEFDSWYLRVQALVRSFPLGARLWDHPDVSTLPMFLLSQEVTFTTPRAPRLSMSAQMNVLLRNPRFGVVTLRPLDEETRLCLEMFRHELSSQGR